MVVTDRIATPAVFVATHQVEHIHIVAVKASQQLAVNVAIYHAEHIHIAQIIKTIL